LLQWGHAFSDVETSEPNNKGGFDLVKLQWGHAFSDVETTPARCFILAREIALQWGHAFSDVETQKLIMERYKNHKLQWGPTLYRRETNIFCEKCGKFSKGFNGATPFLTWKLNKASKNKHRLCFNGATPSDVELSL
jgi:hypothetical protein